MKTMIVSPFVIILCLSLIGLLNTPSRAEEAGWKNGLRINELTVHGGFFVIDTDGNINDCPDQGRFTFAADVLGAREMYGTALAAFLGGKLVHLYWDATCDPYIGGHSMTLLRIREPVL